MATARADVEAGLREVPGQDERAGIGVLLHERAPRRARLRRVIAEAARPLRLGDLHGPVHQIAREDRGACRSREADADVTRGVTDPRLEAQMLADLEVAVDEHGLSRLDHGHDAVGDAPRLLLAR